MLSVFQEEVSNVKEATLISSRRAAQRYLAFDILFIWSGLCDIFYDDLQELQFPWNKTDKHRM